MRNKLAVFLDLRQCFAGDAFDLDGMGTRIVQPAEILEQAHCLIRRFANRTQTPDECGLTRHQPEIPLNRHALF